MGKLRITTVSYLNTLPFVYGINYSGLIRNFELILDVPSECARKFVNKETDIALIPVAALKHLKSYKLIDGFCIGCYGNVKTVLLLSNVELKKISVIHLDSHSLTSVNLVKILCKHHWNINPEFIDLNEQTEHNIASYQSIVAIGNKTFELSEKYSFIYDFGTEWKNFTGLPFVFACWVAQENVEIEKTNELVKALAWGVENKNEAIEKLFDVKKFPFVNINEYLEKNIDFLLDSKKHKAIDCFINYMKS